MTDSNPVPMTDADIVPASADADLQPDAQLEDAGETADTAAGKTAEATQAIKDRAGKIGQQATDKARYFAEEGKTRASGALDQLSQLLNDAAGQVDEKVGAQYGQYARSAAGAVTGFSDSLREKDVDQLVDEARAFIKASPGVAIGAATAVGFVVARLVQAGLEADKAGRA